MQITSTQLEITNTARFPGQWFQLEAGLHYNWHRHYDPSLGRYTQPDPLGFVDGPSVYAYAKSNALKHVDPDGRAVPDTIIDFLIWLNLPDSTQQDFQCHVPDDCVPPEGTLCKDGPDYGRPHRGIYGHYQLYIMEKKKNEGNTCEWRPIKKSWGVASQYPMFIPMCESFPNWRRKGGGR